MADAFISTNLQISGFVVLYWDYFLTLPDEIQYLWRRPVSFGGVLFFINRYLSCIANILVFSYLFFESHSTVSDVPSLCDTLVKYHQALLIVSQAFVAVILTSRVYAIWNCDRRILVIFCVLFASGAGIASWSMATSPNSGKPFDSSCLQPGISKEEAIRYAIDWEYMFVFDLVVFALTLVKSYRGMNDTRGLGLSAEMPLLNVMMRDGILYFLAITLANAANVGTFYLNSSQLRGSLSTMASSISVTLASRIMLNLHKSLARLTMPALDVELLQSNMQFQTVILEDYEREMRR